MAFDSFFSLPVYIEHDSIMPGSHINSFNSKFFSADWLTFEIISNNK